MKKRIFLFFLLLHQVVNLSAVVWIGFLDGQIGRGMADAFIFIVALFVFLLSWIPVNFYRQISKKGFQSPTYLAIVMYHYILWSFCMNVM